MYARRTKMDPLWNAILVGGVKDGKKYISCFHRGDILSWYNFFPSRFLSFVDLLGTTYSASTLATGYGAAIAQPLLRKSVEGREDTLTEAEAHDIIENSLKVLYYRDARSIDKVTLSITFFSVNWIVNILVLVSSGYDH